MDFEPAIVERLVVSPHAAEAILSMEFTEADRERMRQLADENNKGTLTADELVEMEGYRRVGTFLGLMQSKARLLLRKEALDHPKNCRLAEQHDPLPFCIARKVVITLRRDDNHPADSLRRMLLHSSLALPKYRKPFVVSLINSSFA